MKNTVERDSWARYLAEFSKRNESRPTWLQVFGEAGAQSAELDLALTGISLELKGADAPKVQLMFGGDDPAELRHLTHVMTNVESMAPLIGSDGRDEAIEFINKNGEASLLIFRRRARMAAHAAAASAG